MPNASKPTAQAPPAESGATGPRQARVGIEVRQYLQDATGAATLSAAMSPLAPFTTGLQSLSVAGRVAKACWPAAPWASWGALKDPEIEGGQFKEGSHRLPVVAIVVDGEPDDAVQVSLERILPVFDELQQVHPYAISCKAKLPHLDLAELPSKWTLQTQDGKPSTLQLKRSATVAFDPCAALAWLKQVNPGQADPPLASSLVPQVAKATPEKRHSTGTAHYTKLNRPKRSATGKCGVLVVGDSDAAVAKDYSVLDGMRYTKAALESNAASGPSGGYGRAATALVDELAKAKLLPRVHKAQRQPTIAWTCMRLFDTPAAQAGLPGAKRFQPWDDGGPLDALTQTLASLAGCRVRSGAFLPIVQRIAGRPTEIQLDAPPRDADSAFVPLEGNFGVAAVAGAAQPIATREPKAAPFVVGARQVIVGGGVSVLRFDVVRSSKIVATTRLLVRDPADVLLHFGHGDAGRLLIGEGGPYPTWLDLSDWMAAYAADSKASAWRAQWPAKWGAAPKMPAAVPATLALVNCNAVGNPADVPVASRLADAARFREACVTTTKDPNSGIGRILCFQGSVEYGTYFLYRTDFGAPSTDWQLGLLGAVSGAVLAWLAQGKVEAARKLWILGGLAVADWRGAGDNHTVPVWFGGGKEWNSWHLQAQDGFGRLLRRTISRKGMDPSGWNLFVRLLLLYQRTQGGAEAKELQDVINQAGLTPPKGDDMKALQAQLQRLWPRPWRWPLYLEADLSDRLLDHWQQLLKLSTLLVKQREIKRQ